MLLPSTYPGEIPAAVARIGLLFFYRPRFLCLLTLALALGASALAANFEEAAPSSDATINACESEHTKFYGEANYEKAIAVSLQGYARAVETGSREHQILFLRHLTYDNWLLGNSESAIARGLQLLQLADETGSIADRSRANRYLSEIYHSLHDEVRAEAYARTALADADRLDQGNLRAFARECLGLCALSAGDFTAARRDLAAALAHWEAVGNKISAVTLRREQGELAAAEGDLPRALAIYEEVVAFNATRGNPLGIARSLLRSATLLRRLGRLPEAGARLERARPHVTQVGGHSLRVEFFTELALTHEALGEFAPALAAQRTAEAEREMMAGAQARVQAAEAESLHNLELKQRSIDRLNVEKATQGAELRVSVAELRRTREVRTALGVAVLIALAAFAAILAAQRARLHAEHRAHRETRRAQTVAEDAGVLKTRLLAIASHDLKGPLRSMLRSADAIEQEAADPAAVTSGARLLRDNARRMSALVRDLLDLAAIESGNVPFQKLPVDLGLLAAEVVARHAPRAAEKLQTLSFAPPAPGDSLRVIGDADRLTQAIDNLVDNAVKYTPPGGAIIVTAARRAAHICVTVADGGPGLGADDLARMFQPFQRLSAMPTGGEASTGLGLHITRDFIARHGGSIEVDSAPGRGTTFTVLLPVPPT